MKLQVTVEELALSAPFRISDRIFESIDALLVTLTSAGQRGRGEAQGIYYMGETVASMREQLSGIEALIDQGLTHEAVQSMLPPGGARNALDCALWDLEAKLSGQRVWEMFGLQPRRLQTTYTIGLEDDPQTMADRARALRAWPVLKIKLGSDQPMAYMTAIRAARPDAVLMVDANQGWTFDELIVLAPQMKALGVVLIEQPLQRGKDVGLESYSSPVPLCADESCLDSSELITAARRYQIINVKLDKTGGLTEGMRLAQLAKNLGLGLMVGNMGGSSLAMASSFIVGLVADHIDLDGPLDLVTDRPQGLVYENGMFGPPTAALWG